MDNSKQQDIAYFIAFCIEQRKADKGITGFDVVRNISGSGVLDYLNDHYDVLHTQSPQWLLADIDEFISNRKDSGQ